MKQCRLARCTACECCSFLCWAWRMPAAELSGVVSCGMHAAVCVYVCTYACKCIVQNCTLPLTYTVQGVFSRFVYTF